MTEKTLTKLNGPTGLAAEYAALDLPDTARSKVLTLARDYEHAETEIARLRSVKGIRQLGSDELFVRNDENHILRAYHGTKTLSWRKGELYTIDGKFNDEKGQFGRWFKDGNGPWKWEEKPVAAVKFHLSAAGLGAIRVRTSIKIVDETDPEYDRDPETGQIHFVKYRMLFIGRDPSGNMNVQRLLFIHNPTLESLEIIKAAALDEKMGDAVRYRPREAFLDKDGNLPPDIEFHPVRNLGGRSYGFALDLNDRDALRLSLAFINIQKNAMKKGRTVAIRLGVDAWLGRPAFIPYAAKDKDGKITDVFADLDFYGWQQDPSIDDLESLRKHVEAGRAVAEWQSPKGKKVDVKQVEIDADRAAEVIAQENTIDGEIVVDEDAPPDATSQADPDAFQEDETDAPDSEPDEESEIPVTPDPIETPTDQQEAPGSDAPPADDDDNDEDPKVVEAMAKANAAVIAFDTVFDGDPAALDVLAENAIDLEDARQNGGTAMLGRIGRHLKKHADELGRSKEYATALKGVK